MSPVWNSPVAIVCGRGVVPRAFRRNALSHNIVFFNPAQLCEGNVSHCMRRMKGGIDYQQDHNHDGKRGEKIVLEFFHLKFLINNPFAHSWS